MLLTKNKKVLGSFRDSSALEWLETNGLGGWSGSSLCGCHTRRYHGLLMAAAGNPADRILLLSKLDETLVADEKRFELGVNDFGDVLSPTGFQWLNSFRRDFFPEWTYEVPGIRIRKTITMVYLENTTLIRYEVLEATTPFILELLPLIAGRGYHQLKQASENIDWDITFANGLFRNQPYAGAPDIYISVPGSSYQSRNQWYRHFNYAQEKDRGLDFTEDLFNHGLFTVNLKQGDVLNIMVSTENPTGKNPSSLFENEKCRKLGLLKAVPGDLTRLLTMAADQFVVKRTVNTNANLSLTIDLKTVIAGYHWFTDWGRDTMISLPGLCLTTDRFDDAKKIIAAFAESVSMGMIPNRFLDNKEPAEYNSVDGTLWYFNAAFAYLKASNDQDFILSEILPVLKEIMDWHFKGTRYGIHLTSDGLLYAGEPGQQLTWMDARVNGWVITPRMGKPVEIEALWFNALKIFENLLVLNGEPEAAQQILQRAELAKKSFENQFWNSEKNCCYDVIDENGQPDTSFRPNQILAISLPFPLLEGEKAKAVLEQVRVKLYTPYGLRSLAPDDPRYCGTYQGDTLKRDSAYHQGTVWSWLLGPYVEAAMRTYGDSFGVEALQIMDRFSAHLQEACLGNVSEIFDGDPPHQARGCIAQAWSVAEILRVIRTYSLIQAAN